MQKKLYFLISLFVLSVNGNAQLTVFAGPQISSSKYLINEISQPTGGHKHGVTVGLAHSGLIEGPAYFTPLLYYSKKGYKVTFNRRAFPPDTAARNNNTSIHTIEFAPLLQINFSRKKSYPFVRFGPALDLALSGTERFDTAAGKPAVSRKMVFSFAIYSHITASLNGHLGFQHQSGLVIFAHYAYGMSSLNNADNGPKIFHRVAGVAVGWRLGK